MVIKICRICLALDVKVFKLGNGEAKSFIENVFKQNGYLKDLHESHYICFECKALLDKSYNFISRVLKAQETLWHLLKENKTISRLCFKQIDRQIIGFNLVKEFRYIDVFITEDDNNIKKEKESNVLQEIECKLEVDDLHMDPLKNPSDEYDFDKNKIETEFSVQFKDYETDSKVDTNDQFSNPDPFTEDIVYTTFDNIDNAMQYEFDETVHIEQIKEEIDDGNATEIETDLNRELQYQSIVSKFIGKPKKSSEKTKVATRKSSRSVKKNNKKGKKQKHGKKYNELCYDGCVGQPIQQPQLPEYPAKCDHCTYEVPNRTAHFHHYLLMHKDKKYPYAKQTGKQFVCQFCGLVNNKKSRHIDHELTHGTASNFACPQCPKRFANKNRLLKHTYRTHPLQMLECDYCGKKVKSRGSLMIHIRIHTGERPFKCPFCGAGFAHRGNIRPHIRANHEFEMETNRKTNNEKLFYEAVSKS